MVNHYWWQEVEMPGIPPEFVAYDRLDEEEAKNEINPPVVLRHSVFPKRKTNSVQGLFKLSSLTLVKKINGHFYLLIHRAVVKQVSY